MDENFPRFQWSRFKDGDRGEQYVVRGSDLNQFKLDVEAVKGMDNTAPAQNIQQPSSFHPKVYKTPEVMSAQAACMHTWGNKREPVGRWPGPWQTCTKCQMARLFVDDSHLGF